MSPKDQCIAIAKKCGWRKMDTGGLMKFRPWVHKNADLEDHKNWKTDTELPNYLFDHNAMHGAWKMLTDEQKRRASWNLVQIVDGWSVWEPNEYDILRCWEMSLDDISNCLDATPAQCAEALLRATGKWEDK